jgi:outer membrane biosynthesis protein TonB
VTAQNSPDSPLQAAASSIVKKFSKGPTGFDQVMEGKYSVAALKLEKSNNDSFRKILATQEEITGIQKQIIDRYAQRLANVDPSGYRVIRALAKAPTTPLAEVVLPPSSTAIAPPAKPAPIPVPEELPPPKVPPVQVAKVQPKEASEQPQPMISQKIAKEELAVANSPVATKPKSEKMEKPKTEKSARAVSLNETESTYRTLAKLRADIVPEFAESNVQMRIQERSDGRILVWATVGGKNSAAFFAGTPRHAARLTEDGMRQWLNDAVQQIALVEKVETVAKMRDIHSFSNGNVSMKIKKQGTGEVDVIFADSFS